MTILRFVGYLMVGAWALTVAHVGSAAAAGEASDPEARGDKAGATSHVLAMTWQPGFCLAKPEAPECARQAQNKERGNLTLHGLWQVKKTYCGIDADLKKQDREQEWTTLPKLELSGGTAARLADGMPGVASGLDRHQWLMSGTCQAATPEDYFVRSLDMLDVVERSAVGAFLEEHVGKPVTMTAVAAAFDAAFGTGAGARVRMSCRNVDGQSVITGITVGLSSDEGDLGHLILDAGETKSKCAGGLLAEVAAD